MSISRREFLSTAFAATITAGAGPSLFAAEKKNVKPNIVFIFADDLGWGDLGCYGSKRIKTSNLDKLAAQGTRLTQFYVSGSVCSPSRASVLTGDFPARHKIHGHFASQELNEQRGMPQSLNPDTQMLPRLLKQGGYTTCHIGKWHLGSEDALKYGYDLAKTTNGGGESGYPLPEGYQQFRNHSTEVFTDDAIEFVQKHKNEPFFLNLWYLDPHATLEPTEEMMAEYKHLRKSEKYAGAQQIYYSIVTNLDKQIGRFLDKLESLGLSDNTIVMFSSDNGPEDLYVSNASHSAAGWPGPFRGRKRSLYEGGIRVPFIVRRPGRVGAGAVDNDTVMASVDLLPSLCSVAGIKYKNVDGEDMSAVFEGGEKQRTKPLFWEYREIMAGYQVNRSPFMAIREGKWKLLANADRSRCELYDIPSDPMELDNLSEDKPEIVDQLFRKLLKWHSGLPDGHYSPYAGKNDYDWPQPVK
jgi:N-acetylgalactosamine-6-sulfatase